MNVAGVKERCSSRGRVAFSLAVAERCLPSLAYDEKVHRLASRGLADAWRWAAGENVAGDVLNAVLESEDEECLAVYGCTAPPASEGAIQAATCAIAYAAREAYRRDGVRVMSSPLHEVDESLIDELVAFAARSPEFDAALVARLATVLTDRHRREPGDDFGRPVIRSDLLRACNATSDGA